uniref:Survival of motor neuron-related-splicing factor 30-like n=1 Tax=Phallusia mammillata TaxID=59560 RepID=A0A6F9DTP6_9ASCI|nr:survival of motor neuron-related-splicing factor 30-like [Phallusia mammillata]
MCIVCHSLILFRNPEVGQISFCFDQQLTCFIYSEEFVVILSSKLKKNNLLVVRFVYCIVFLTMAEDLSASLTNYKVQLTQVEAALSSDPENDELLKLKQDLEEVIQLTEDLLGTETAKEAKEKHHPASTSKRRSSSHWSAGDKCLALRSTDGKYYEAVIEDILPQSETVAVSFPQHKKSDICQISTLRPLPAGGDRVIPGSSQKSKSVLKKEQIIQQREYRKKRNLKKKMRVKEKEAESEVSKNKWMDFNKKVYSKTWKGRVKKSIFASPEGADGKVGVGTCGTADKNMTKYGHGAKYNARHLIPR